MRDDRPSTTAEMVCAWRALEALVPPESRILFDPYAKGFLGPARRALVDAAERLPARAHGALFVGVDAVMQGVMTFVVARHRAMDEVLSARAAAAGEEPLEQVVLLGAGYDTRAVRLCQVLDAATVFEVDHPATGRRKAELAPAVFGGAKSALRVPVPVDFARERLDERLAAAGFEPRRPTLWVWEGVTMYLEESAVKDALGLIRGLSAKGTLLTLDVWCPPEDPLQRWLRRDLVSAAMRLLYSEPFVWGPPLREVEPFFRAAGYAVRECLSGADLVARYAPSRWDPRTNAHVLVCAVE